jgi:hypothetical protein
MQAAINAVIDNKAADVCIVAIVMTSAIILTHSVRELCGSPAGFRGGIAGQNGNFQPPAPSS